MKIIKSIPKNDGFYMPAEFSPHYGCIMIWPERGDSWQYGGYEARKAFIKAAEIIAKSEKLTVLASEAQYNNARAVLAENIRVVELSTDDSWARDTAPTFVTNGKTIRGIDWNFNAWGGLVDGLYFPWERDRQLARKLCDLYDIDVYDERDFILEGGSIHSNGAGTILTTEECLLSEGRNSHMTKAEIEQKLKDTLGAEKSFGYHMEYIMMKPTDTLIISVLLPPKQMLFLRGLMMKTTHNISFLQLVLKLSKIPQPQTAGKLLSINCPCLSPYSSPNTNVKVLTLWTAYRQEQQTSDLPHLM